MASLDQARVAIQRRPLNTSPSARLNSYNHHALAPWLEHTGYLTTLYLNRREQEIAPFNMGRWLTPRIQECMLNPPAAIHHLAKDEIRRLLEIAAELNYDISKAEKSETLGVLAAEMEQRTEVFHSRRLWSRIAPDLDLKSCVVDVYAEVRDPNFEVRLIKINPWGAHSGSGSLLFHWLDDADIIDLEQHDGTAVIRLVEPGKAKALSRDEALEIGRGGIIKDELRCLRERGLEWVLEDDKHAEFMELPVPDGQSRLTTKKDGLEIFRKGEEGKDPAMKPRDHPRLLKLTRAYRVDQLCWISRPEAFGFVSL
ncbi:hypothetical protein CSAL01_08702 [Colletotrichum salicis]|uniref:Uncharacterized protein n=1 Tax=Colletotrichum salicis TaxID=1209931 RepID=A0A135V4T0_9PEZI|nr:hypothetical protein CSAL01_08702 [Colletotrichum salicis]